jgi:hypothetical protein
MILRVDLWKCLWLGRAGGVTANAQYYRVKLGWSYSGWVGRMFGLRPMARLAVHVGVLAVPLRVEYVRMTGFTRFMAGKVHWPRRDFSDCVSTIMAILPEALRDNEAADYQKHNKGENEESRESKKMSCILEYVHPALSPVANGRSVELSHAIQIIHFSA